jgi:uroporphyrinogen-III decarboxylase
VQQPLIATSLRLQGNMDPGVLFGSADTIEQRVVETIEKGRGQRHIMNLGHGVMVGVAAFELMSSMPVAGRHLHTW